MDNVETSVLVSRSFDYVEQGYKRKSFEGYYLDNRDGIETPLNFSKRLSIETDIYKMFVFDFIICNMDRHGRNIDILRNRNNVKLSCLFDNSLCFVHNKNNSDYKNRSYFNDEMSVNNYIGERNLLLNLYNIDKIVNIRDIRDSDREILFQGLGRITTREFRDYYWWFIRRRIEDVKSFKIPFIKWF